MRVGGHPDEMARLHLWSSGQRHRQRKSLLENVASRRSRHGLDWMNFFISDVQEGFGAFVAFISPIKNGRRARSGRC